MKIAAVIFVGLVALLIIGVWLEIRAKGGKHRPLSAMKPNASAIFLKTLPSRTGEQHGYSLPGLTDEMKEERRGQQRHRHSAEKRAKDDKLREKQKRIRPWDTH